MEVERSLDFAKAFELLRPDRLLTPGKGDRGLFKGCKVIPVNTSLPNTSFWCWTRRLRGIGGGEAVHDGQGLNGVG
ncbi:hypothetical protein H5410_063582 [Solanum commersonii]|uniref:Uncharacterized protein n=1 Tax=Solanum commersonii TaxID=4109 RepID=A0A9J5WFR0_SOLCO|nr:hypothetical protein H5410_063582 [Solanum commersonii]